MQKSLFSLRAATQNLHPLQNFGLGAETGVSPWQRRRQQSTCAKDLEKKGVNNSSRAEPRRSACLAKCIFREHEYIGTTGTYFLVLGNSNVFVPLALSCPQRSFTRPSQATFPSISSCYAIIPAFLGQDAICCLSTLSLGQHRRKLSA